MTSKISYHALKSYRKILIYGAGQVGTAFIKSLMRQDFNKHSITVWDARNKINKDICGIAISKPDFKFLSDTEDIVVIIAIGARKNAALIDEIKYKFLEAGYKHIFSSGDVSSFIENIKVGDFENKAYQDCYYQDDIDFSAYTPRVKPIAFYLPQFHEIPENNEWWGEGFTEWTNTKRATPRYKGHYQPREPHDDFGYYDLSDVNIIRKQAELARKHGIYGWSIYYYWFSGRRLLTKPLDILLEHKDIDINFCLTWCNETWTKRWVGDEREVLIDCEYREEDPEKFIDDIKKYTDDKRYIRIDGKPIIMLYRIHDIPNIRDVVHRWRERAREIGIGEIEVISVINPYTLSDLELNDCFDGETEFTPLNSKYAMNPIHLHDDSDNVVSSKIFTYSDCIDNYRRAVEMGNHSAYLSCMCGYDNSPRYREQFSIYDLEFSIEAFYDILKFITDEAISYKKDFIFIFAWNEWAESAYLEPDKRFGYMMINTLSKAINGLPLDFARQ
jgi:hypothetical protein